MAQPRTRDRRWSARLALGAIAVLASALTLAACGSDDGGGSGAGVNTTTVTTVEGEAAAVSAEETAQAGNTANPDVSGAVATSNAAASIPGDDVPVAAATSSQTTTDPATGLTTTPTTPATAEAAGATPIVPANPVLPGADTAILSRPFSADSPWNTPITGSPVDPGSERLMRQAQTRIAVEELPNGDVNREPRTIDEGLAVNVTRWTVPVFSDAQQDAVQRVTVCRQFDCGQDATTSITIPGDACPDPRYDGWMTVIDNTNRTALDFWRARCEADGSLSYHYVKKWDLDGPGFQEPTGVSARGSGLPLFAGLITPEEIRDGRIDHALAISVPGAAQRRYVQPASRTDGVGRRSALPEGARLRLRPGATGLLSRTFVRNGIQRQTAMTLISALERYGAIVVDRSAAPTMYAQRNADWTGVLPLNLLQDIGLEQFEAIELPPMLFDPPRAGEATSATAIAPGTPGSIPGTASGSQGSTGEFGSPSAEGLVP